MVNPYTSFLVGAVGAGLFFSYTLRSDIYDTSRTIESSISSSNDYVKRIVKENEETQEKVKQLEINVSTLLEDRQALENQLKRQTRKLNEQQKKIQSLTQDQQRQFERIHRILQLNDEESQQQQQQQQE